MTTAEKILRKIEDFQTLPTIYSALTEVMSNPYSSANDVANVISSDQAAASKVLKAANSPLYGYSGRIDTMNKAIMYMGFAEVKNIVAALSIVDIFARTKLSAYFNPVEFWKYSVAVGVISRILAKESGALGVEHYFLAGILHDLGKLLLYQCAPAEFSYGLQVAAARRTTLRLALMETIGISHSALGELLAERWKMPPPIRSAIRYAHVGLNGGKPDPLVAIVHISAIAAQMFGLGSSAEDTVSEPNPLAWEVVHLNDDVFSRLQHQIIQDYEGTLASLQL